MGLALAALAFGLGGKALGAGGEATILDLGSGGMGGARSAGGAGGTGGAGGATLRGAGGALGVAGLGGAVVAAEPRLGGGGGGGGDGVPEMGQADFSLQRLQRNKEQLGPGDVSALRMWKTMQ